MKQLWRLDTAPLPLEMTRKTLEKAAEDDDRVWLARANLAIRTGQFDRAAQWLDACASRRPHDAVAWRARLDLSRASNDLAGAWRALEGLPADALSRTELLHLRAWLASLTGDPKAERAALSALIEQVPGDAAALDRLTVLASAEHDSAEVGRLRTKKAEALDAQNRYKALLRGDSIGDPTELRPRRNLGSPGRSPRLGLIRDGRLADRARATSLSSPGRDGQCGAEFDR